MLPRSTFQEGKKNLYYGGCGYGAYYPSHGYVRYPDYGYGAYVGSSRGYYTGFGIWSGVNGKLTAYGTTTVGVTAGSVSNPDADGGSSVDISGGTLD